MNSFTLLIDILWILTVALRAAVAVTIARRGLSKTFPWFFVYTITALSFEVALFFLHYPGNAYALVYWYGEVLTILMAVGAIFETVKYLLPPYPFLKNALRIVWGLGAVAALIAMLLLVLARVDADGDRLLAIIMLGERSVRFAEASWLVLVIAFMSYFGRRWQQLSVGIVAGFGFQSALTLAFFELRIHSQLLSDSVFVLLNSLAYSVAALIWACYFLPSSHTLPSMPLPSVNLTEWNEVATEYCTQQWHRRY